MFFVLSGYLLYRAFARAALRRSGPVAIVAATWRAARRASCPAYYVATPRDARAAAAAGDVPGRRLVDAAQVPLFFLFGQNYTPDTLLKLNAATWTLAVEVVVLPAAAGDRPGWRCGSARAAPAGRRCCSAGSLPIGLAWNPADYAAGWGPVASHSRALVPAVLRLRDAGRAAGRVRRARGVPPLGARGERRPGRGRRRPAGR